MKTKRNKQIQKEILELLRLKSRSRTALQYMLNKHIVNTTTKEFEDNLMELEKLDKVETFNLIYVKRKL